MNGPVERGAFLQAMRDVASSVTVVTTDGPAGRHAATVSAFCSVSADPPMVLVCLAERSRIARLVRENGVFCVNVLPESRSDLAARCAGGIDPPVEDRLDGVRLAATRSRAPVIEGVTALSCEVCETAPQATHLVVFGRVIEVHCSRRAPLAYRDGVYCGVAPKNPAIGEMNADHSR